MKNKLISLVLMLLLSGCASVNATKEANTTSTPLPSFVPANIRHTDFFMEKEDYPKTSEVIAYCKDFVCNFEQPWNDLTDCFENEMINHKGYTYSFEYEEYYNYGESYLFKVGVVNNSLVHEAVTNNTTLGSKFYEFITHYGEIPFQYVTSTASKSPITGYRINAMSDDGLQAVQVWLIRGKMEDVLNIEEAFLSKTNETVMNIHLLPINQDWYIYYCDTFSTHGEG